MSISGISNSYYATSIHTPNRSQTAYTQTNPDYAKKMAEQIAYGNSFELHGPLVDMSHNPIRYSVTREVEPLKAYLSGTKSTVRPADAAVADANQREATQRTNASADQETDSGLSVSVQHGLDDIVSNPKYARKMAEVLGTESVVIPFPMDKIPKNGDPDYVWNAFSKGLEIQSIAAEQNRARRMEYYESKVAEGLPPAELYAEMLAYVADDTDYNARFDEAWGWPKGERSAFWQAQHDYLRDVLDKQTPSLSAPDAASVVDG